ncbi:MAG: glycosyltransferase [Patescibacteria group bacterium]|nr:glycosyltransferase [Patescibacteria group bacterium]
MSNSIGIYCTNNHVYPVPDGLIYANLTVAGELADTLADLGADVTFFAPAGSQTRAKLVTFDMEPFDSPAVHSRYPDKDASYRYEDVMLAKIFNFARENNLSLLHTHCRPFSIVNQAASHPQLPVLATVHDPLTAPAYKILPLYNQFSNLHWSSLSLVQRWPYPDLSWAGNVGNGVDPDFWTFSPAAGKYLLFVGRLTAEKGVDLAVQIAIKTGLPLKIAGSVYDVDQEFFVTKVKPFLNNQIEYLGPVPRRDLPALYGGALALLAPIRWPEPFGLVFVEALVCGTPVIAANLGSAAEVIVEGQTGFIVEPENPDQLAAAVKKAAAINRQTCRDHVLKNFTLLQMAKNYLSVYEKIINHRF